MVDSGVFVVICRGFGVKGRVVLGVDFGLVDLDIRFGGEVLFFCVVLVGSWVGGVGRRCYLEKDKGVV